MVWLRALQLLPTPYNAIWPPIRWTLICWSFQNPLNRHLISLLCQKRLMGMMILRPRFLAETGAVIVYSSADPKVASISASGQIKITGAGTSLITASK